jgi:hypothetical protein
MDLLALTGFMMVVGAIPWGIMIALLARYTGIPPGIDPSIHIDWSWAIILGVAFTIMSALVGSALLGLVTFLERRQNRRRSIDGK